MIPGSGNSGKTEKSIRKLRDIKLNARVSARNYNNQKKIWEFGIVIKKLGALHYLIQLDDGRIWKRHIDQIREVGKDTGNSNQFDSNDDTNFASNAFGSMGNPGNMSDFSDQESAIFENLNDSQNEGEEIPESVVGQGTNLFALGNNGNSIANPVSNLGRGETTMGPRTDAGGSVAPRRSTRIRKPVVKLNL
jgi:hypothetical protein